MSVTQSRPRSSKARFSGLWIVRLRGHELDLEPGRHVERLLLVLRACGVETTTRFQPERASERKQDSRESRRKE